MKVAASTGALLERSDELARIESALADARTGRGRFVVVEGPAGIGKTALLTEARTAAAESGMRVLRSRATKMETNFAFGVVRQLFEPPLVEASELERADLLQAAAGVAADLLGLPGAPPADRQSSSGVDPSFAILHGLYWLCANLAAAGPLFLVVDDAHWADAASVRYLAFLLTRLEELDIALVVATRPHEVGTDAELLTRLTTDSSADVIRLAPLTRAAVVQLLEAELGRAPAPDVVDTCLRVTQGRPFLVRELVTALSEQGIGSGVETVGRSVRLRLLRLPEHAGRLARALAVLERSDLLQAARLAGLEELEAADAADLLATAGIIEPGRPLTFVHPLVRDGIYSELSSSERAQGHRRAAELFAEQPGADARVAEHLLVSELAGDHWAVEQLVAAARAARKQGAPDSEAVFLRRALAEPPPPGDRSALLLDLGMAEASAGLAGWPEHLQQAVDTAPGAEAAAEAAMVLAHALSRAHRYAEAVEVLDRASSALDSRSDELALQLDAAAVLPALNDPVTAPSVGLRYETLRERAAGDPAAPPEVLAAVAFISVLSNEPAEIGADFATRALLAEDSATTRLEGQAMVLVRSVVFADDVLASFGRAVCGGAAAARCLDRPGADNRRRRPTCRGPPRSRLACAPTRRSERCRRRRSNGACRDRAPRATHIPPHERRSANQQCSSTRASSMRPRRRSRPSTPKQRADSPRPGVFASPADVCGSHKDESQKGSRTSWALGQT